MTAPSSALPHDDDSHDCRHDDRAAALRRAFWLDPDTVFLNHGSFGACPREVLEVQRGWQQEMERNPVLFFGRRSAALLAEARQALAAELGAAADDLVFVNNATTGVNIMASSLAASGRLLPGDEVLATDLEYGACDETWRRICARAGALYRQVPIPLPFDSQQFAARMLAAVTPRTKVLFASHITSTTALIFPLAELCAEARERGLFTLIDGAHAPGHIDVDLRAIGADAYTGNCHKWMCAPKGAAFLHVQPQHHRSVQALVTSWGDVAGDAPTTPFDGYTGTGLLDRRLQWQGTRDLSSFLSVPAAIAFQRRHARPAVRAHCHALLSSALQRIGAAFGTRTIGHDKDFAQMAVIPVPHRDGEALRRTLFDVHRIEVPATWHAGQVYVRPSVAAYTTAADLLALERALAAVASAD